MEVSNNIIKINDHLSLNLEQALKDEAYLLSYAGVLSELQQQTESSKNILLILIIAKLLIKVNKKSLLQQDTLWLKNIIENINFDKVIYSSINLNINFYKNYKSAILQLIYCLESLSDESKFDQPTVQKITVYLKQHATNLIIADNWGIENNFPFAGLRSKKTQAIDKLFKAEKRGVEWLRNLYAESKKWQKQENSSFWQLSARTEAVQKLEYRTAYQIFMSYEENTNEKLKAIVDDLIETIKPDLWEHQGTFGLPTGIKKLLVLKEKRAELGDFQFLWQAKNIIKERVNSNICKNPFRVFTRALRSDETNKFYKSFLANCKFVDKNILKNLKLLFSSYIGHEAIVRRGIGKEIRFKF